MMSLKHMSGPLLLLISLGICGCATTGGSDSTPAHDNMDAVVWLQTSTEYAAVAAGIYATATAALEEIAKSEAGRTHRMAIVLDIDETVLDNSRYQVQLVFDDTTYEGGTWDQWIALRAASAVPGAVDFIRASQSLGFHVAFITNRACRARPDTPDDCPQKLDTRVNLEEIGIDTKATTLFLRGERPADRCRALLSAAERPDGKWSSDKTSRRACVRLDHGIVMLFGDQLGDFTEEQGGPSGESGRDIATVFGEYWGKTWFMLPNPTYGGWRPGTFPEKRSLIRGID